MNIYRHDFVCICPNNGQAVGYHLEVRTQHLVMAEDIVAAGKAAAQLGMPYHENIADMFYDKFGGWQRLVAYHHGVEIETHRGRE